MTEPFLLSPLNFQIAYVTRNLERARARIGEAMGITNFTNVPATGIDLRIPADSAMSLKVEIAWTGACQIELIEPVSGAIDIYIDGLPVGDGVAFHHVGALIPGTIDDWERFRSTIPETKIALEGRRSQMRFIYIDERVALGHFVEYVWMSKIFLDANPGWQPMRTLARAAFPFKE